MKLKKKILITIILSLAAFFSIINLYCFIGGPGLALIIIFWDSMIAIILSGLFYILVKKSHVYKWWSLILLVPAILTILAIMLFNASTIIYSVLAYLASAGGLVVQLIAIGFLWFYKKSHRTSGFD